MIINNIRMHHVDLWLVQKKKKKTQYFNKIKIMFQRDTNTQTYCISWSISLLMYERERERERESCNLYETTRLSDYPVQTKPYLHHEHT